MKATAETAGRGETPLPYQVLTDALADMTGDRRRVLRIRWQGQVWTLRGRGVVDTGDRVYLHSPDRSNYFDSGHVEEAETVRSPAGRTVGVHFGTPWGEIAVDAPPGLRAPSRRRARARGLAAR